MEEMLVILIFLAVAALIYLWYCVAKEFARIAAMKGHTEARYFWWTFLLSAVGMLMVVALPDHSAGKSAPAANDDLPEI